MAKRTVYWGSGKHSRNIFIVRFWRFRLELWKDLGDKKEPEPNGIKMKKEDFVELAQEVEAIIDGETPEERKERLSDHWEDL